MSDQFTPTSAEPTNDDKLWAAIGYPIPLLPIITLLTEEKKNRPFLKFHAVQSIALNIVIFVVIFILSLVTFGFGAFCLWILWLIVFWPAYDSYKGNKTEIPIITNFLKKQGWVD